MNKKFITLIVLITIVFIVGCGGSDLTYVCNNGNQVSDPDLCSDNTNVRTTSGGQAITGTPANSAVNTAPVGVAQQEDSSLIQGYWNCQSTNGPGTAIISTNKLDLGSVIFNYQLVPSSKTLKVSNANGNDQYQYTVSSNSFSMSYSDGWRMDCSKTDQATVSNIRSQQAAAQSASGSSSGGGDSGYYDDSGNYISTDYAGSDCWASAGCSDYDSYTDTYTYDDYSYDYSYD